MYDYDNNKLMFFCYLPGTVVRIFLIRHKIGKNGAFDSKHCKIMQKLDHNIGSVGTTLFFSKKCQKSPKM
jgi:hypothetical protein